MDIQYEIFEDLRGEIGIETQEEQHILVSKIKNAVYEVKNRRDYPSHFTESDIQKDLRKLYSNIHDLALYDYNQTGAEGQMSHNENGTSRTWKDREECLKGVFAWAGF